MASKYGYTPDEGKLSYEELRTLFKTLDEDNDGFISNAEFIKGLKKNPWMADKLGKHKASHSKRNSSELGCRAQHTLSLICMK